MALILEQSCWQILISKYEQRSKVLCRLFLSLTRKFKKMFLPRLSDLQENFDLLLRHAFAVPFVLPAFGCFPQIQWIFHCSACYSNPFSLVASVFFHSSIDIFGIKFGLKVCSLFLFTSSRSSTHKDRQH